MEISLNNAYRITLGRKVHLNGQWDRSIQRQVIVLADSPEKANAIAQSLCDYYEARSVDPDTLEEYFQEVVISIEPGTLIRRETFLPGDKQ